MTCTDAGRTVVLLNGRGLPPHPISMVEDGAPSLSTNVNQLPAAAMARVEILRDSASAIYGTDAAGGFVNSITRRNFDGRDVPAPFNGLPITDTASGVSRDNDFDNRLSTDSSYCGGFVRGNYDASGAFVGARPTGHLGIITTSGSTSSTLAANGTFYLIPLVDKNIGLRQTLPSHNLDDSTAVTPADLADFNALNSSRPVTSSITHNANVAYAFPRKRGSNFNDVSVRRGVNNVFDEDPPLADADAGYQRGAGTNPRGRVYSAQVSKRF